MTRKREAWRLGHGVCAFALGLAACEHQTGAPDVASAADVAAPSDAASGEPATPASPAAAATAPAAKPPAGPVAGTRLPDAYVRDLARIAVLWGWPLVNLHNRHLVFSK